MADNSSATGGIDSFGNPPPTPPPLRRNTSCIALPQYATVMPVPAAGLRFDTMIDSASPTQFATVGTGKTVDKAQSRIPSPTRRKAPAPLHMDSPPKLTDAVATSIRRPLLRSASTIDVFQRKSPPKFHDKESDSGSSDGGSRRATMTTASSPSSKLRFPLRKKDSPGKVAKSPSSIGAPPTPQQTSPEKADNSTSQNASDTVIQLTSRVTALLGEIEQMELENSDLMWKCTQIEGKLHHEQQLRASAEKDHEAAVATLTQQLHAQTAAAQMWQAKFVEAVNASTSNAITMAEFEEKEAEIARLWQCVDTMAGQVEGIATLSTARATTQDCTVEYMHRLLEGKSLEVDTLRNALYDTVTLCFLHELAQGHDSRVLHTFMASLGSDGAAFEWLKARFCSKIIDDGPFSKLENCVGTIVVQAGTSHVLAGIVDDDMDAGLILPALDFSVVKTASSIECCLECVQQSNGVHTIALGGYLTRRRSLVEASTRKSLFSIVFDALNVRPAKYKVVAVVKPLWSLKDKSKLTSMLLQDFGVAALMLTTTAEMALRNAGLTTGVVVDIGVDGTFVVPIYDSTIMTHAVVQVHVGGRHVLEHTAALFRVSSPQFAALAPDMQMQLVLAILQSKGHVGYGPAKPGGGQHDEHPPIAFEIQKEVGASWILAADTELFLGPEVLFHPSLHLHGSTWEGLHDALLRSVDLCDPIVRDELLGGVVLSGRVSKLPGLKRRLVKEVVVSRHELLGKIHVHTPDHAEYQAYWGACTLAKYASDDQWQLE
ncbi:hypothetical protein H310_01572 [Aphanomyces invadans]|uniref:Uncharacterized protein n=1 Tax=Aphanomyces invadans TaxID=157072 RepID=A0A024UT45_9STRA|nr:hypothetical protein H310_01572 [Aphanomyces invadans]ETW09130.1 hypothetical protein H310_01572 [Aphanomyces invadans]|eukprot:XP_008862935.1 hypothetical protein H310_01572 [Aphanomyces invadans]